MKICVVQTKPVKGDIQRNIDDHKRLLDVAISYGADIIIFPELSITGYEPELAKELATVPDDSRFDDFQKISDVRKVIIGVGIPTKNDRGICISMILFQPQKPRQTYSKKYLHADEEPFFVTGENATGLIGDTNIALAICYELSVPEHADDAFRCGAEIYIASAVKSLSGVEKAAIRLSEIANKYSMPVLMSNCIGLSGGYYCAGKTSIWNDKGLLIGQLNSTEEGVLILDTGTKRIIEKTI
jgi:predicted amidohydrolase